MVYVTHPDMACARRISRILLKENLCACAVMFPVKSMYSWKGKFKYSNEMVTLLKTVKKNRERLLSRVQELHPYEIPAIIVLDARANAKYEHWIGGMR